MMTKKLQSMSLRAAEGKEHYFFGLEAFEDSDLLDGIESVDFSSTSEWDNCESLNELWLTGQPNEHTL